MKIVVALDKFKGCLSASEACGIVKRALHKKFPDGVIVSRPMADGGEGTTAALHAALGGRWVTMQVTGPLPNIRRRARFLWLAQERLAVVEMAQASGLVWLKPEQRNPLLTTTRGTGELMARAIQLGAHKIWLAVGGSATVDGGVGAATALGWKFLDAHGRRIGEGGGELKRIVTIHPPIAQKQGSFPAVTVLCDVDNPLCGTHGAARVFGPQKGATAAMVRQIDAGLRHVSKIVKEQLGKDILLIPGGGAAGGLASGAVAFMNAQIAPGIETVMASSGLPVELADADWVITGEGQFDEQSLRGKVVAGISALARQSGVKVAVLAGRVKLSETAWRRAGVDIARAITPTKMKTQDAMKHAKELLFDAAKALPIAGQSCALPKDD